MSVSIDPGINRFQYLTVLTQNGDATKYITRKFSENERGYISTIKESSVTIYDSSRKLKTVTPNSPTIVKYS